MQAIIAHRVFSLVCEQPKAVVLPVKPIQSLLVAALRSKTVFFLAPPQNILRDGGEPDGPVRRHLIYATRI
jgi:hypothetical protein